jgi:hypothetical protein
MRLSSIIPLYEMPQIVGDVDWFLSTDESNEKHALGLMKNADIEFLEDYNQLKLYRLRNQFFAVNRAGDRMAYWINTVHKYQSMIKETCVTQVALWRDSDNPHAKDLPAHVFFNYLLPENHNIMIDGQQTTDGKRFWVNRIADAFDKGLHVYYANVMAPRELIKLVDKDDFMKNAKSIPIWGDNYHFRDKKIIISDHLLTPKPDVKFED